MAQVFQNKPDYGRADSSSLGTVTISAQTFTSSGQSMPGTLCGYVYNNQNTSPCNGLPIASIGSYTAWDQNAGVYIPYEPYCGCGGGYSGGYVQVKYIAASSCPAGYTFSAIQPSVYSCVKN